MDRSLMNPPSPPSPAVPANEDPSVKPCARVFRDPVHFLALGFGSGCAPKAPGTFGTLAALPLYLLIQPLPLWAYLLLTVVPGFGALLACRVLQGVGAALVLGCGPALATAQFPEALRARALAAYAATLAAGSTIGPLFGGVLVEAFGWQAVYWFRAPIALGALLLSWRLPDAPRKENRRQSAETADLKQHILQRLLAL